MCTIDSPDTQQTLKNTFLTYVEQNLKWLVEEGARTALCRRRFPPATYHDLLEECRQHLHAELRCPDALAGMASRYEPAGSVPDPQHMKPYALGCARNLARSYLRSTVHRHERRRIRGSAIQRVLDDVPTRDEGELPTADLAARAGLALNTLPTNQRWAFELVVFQQMRKGRAATILGCDRKTFRAWLRQAKAALQRMLSSDS